MPLAMVIQPVFGLVIGYPDPPEFEHIESIGSKSMHAGVDEMDDDIVPEGDDGRCVNDALIHFAIKPVTNGVDGLLKRLLIQPIEDGIAIPRIIWR